MIEESQTPPEIAKGLKVDPATVVGWIKSGRLRAWKLGEGTVRPRYRVPQSAIEEFLRSREVNVPPPKRRKRRKQTQEIDFVAMMNLGGDR